MSLVVDDVARWLVTPAGPTGAGLREIVIPGPKLPTAPDRVVILTRYGGPGLITENLEEVIAFQARCRGIKTPGKSPRYTPDRVSDDAGKDAYADAEDLAIVTDTAFVDAAIPTRMNGRYVRLIRGGPPQFLTIDSAGRVHFVGNYLITAARQ